MEHSAVQALFRGADVFVTGGTGFLGKLLLEKLLRCCPDIGTIFLLMRAKKGKQEAERFAELFEGPVFATMKQVCSDYTKKVKFVTGDCGLPKLGLSDEDTEMLCQRVNIVFHIAATVRFDEPLRTAVNINVRGTKDLLQLSKKMSHLKSLIHVSTAYAHCPTKQIDEKFYSTTLKCDTVMQLVDLLPDDILNAITPKLLGEWPNTYAFTKAIGEDAVQEFGKGLPVAMVRPAIVISTVREPVAGWINNIYGATGVTVGAGLGLLRTMHCDPDLLAELVPADMVVNCLIATAWDVATRYKQIPRRPELDKFTRELLGDRHKEETVPESESENDIMVLNYVSSPQNPITWGEYMKYNECGKKYPSMRVLWYYCFRLNKYRIMHNLYTIFLHFLPALIVDTMLRLIGKEPLLWNAYKKIHKFVDVIAYFSTQKWRFTNNNVQAVWKKMNPIDQELFDFNIAGLNWPTAFEVCMQGLRIHLANENPGNLEVARKRYKRLKIAHYTIVYTLRFLFLGLLTWVIFTMVM